jgi:hypothetical protein
MSTPAVEIDAPDWADARRAAVIEGVTQLVLRESAGGEQRALLLATLSGLRACGAQPGDLLPSVHLPLLVAAHVSGDDREAVPVAVLAAVLELGMDLADAMADGEIDGRWPELPAAAVPLVAMLMTSAVPMRAVSMLEAPATRRLAMLDALGRQGLLIAYGQQLDLMLTRARAPGSATVAASNRGKTGERRALYAILAARFAGAAPAVEDELATMARALGEATQLTNDLHDLFAVNPSRDLSNGTRTWPIAWALEQLTGEDRRELLSELDAATRPGADHAALQARLADLNAAGRTRLQIAYHSGLAVDALDRLSPRPAVRAVLTALITSAGPQTSLT